MKKRRLVLSYLALGLVTILSSCGSDAGSDSGSTPNNSNPLNHNNNSQPVTKPVTGVLSDSNPGFNDNNLVTNPNPIDTNLPDNTSKNKDVSLDVNQVGFNLNNIKKEFYNKKNELQPGSSNSNTINKNIGQNTNTENKPSSSSPDKASANNSPSATTNTDSNKPKQPSNSVNHNVIQTIDSKETETHSSNDITNNSQSNSSSSHPADASSSTKNNQNVAQANSNPKAQADTISGNQTTKQSGTNTENTVNDHQNTDGQLNNAQNVSSATTTTPNSSAQASQQKDKPEPENSQTIQATGSEQNNPTSSNDSSPTNTQQQTQNKPRFNLKYYPNIKTTNKFDTVDTFEFNNQFDDVSKIKTYNVDLDQNDFVGKNAELRVYQADNSFIMSFNDFITKTLVLDPNNNSQINNLNFLELYVSGFANVYTKTNIPVSSHLSINNSDIIKIKTFTAPTPNTVNSSTINSEDNLIHNDQSVYDNDSSTVTNHPNSNSASLNQTLDKSQPLKENTISSHVSPNSNNQYYYGSRYDRSARLSSLDNSDVILYGNKNSNSLDAITSSTLSNTLYDIHNSLDIKENSKNNTYTQSNVKHDVNNIKESIVASNEGSTIAGTNENQLTGYNLNKDKSYTQNLVIDPANQNHVLIQPDDDTFTGNKVKVAIIDGNFNIDGIKGADQSWNLHPQKIDVSDLNHNHAIDLDSSTHALVVGSILSGKRKSPDSTTTIGVASKAQLYYASIWNSAQYLGEVYQRVYTNYHPTVINNSFLIFKAADYNNRNLVDNGLNRDNQGISSATENTQAIGKHISVASYSTRDNDYDFYDYDDYDQNQTNNLGTQAQTSSITTSNNEAFDVNSLANAQYNPNTIDPDNSSYIYDKSTANYKKLESSVNIYASLEAGLHNIVNSANAPLIVFAAGNIGIPDFNAAYKNMTADQIVEHIKDKNSGFKIDKSFVTATLLRDSDIRKNFLVVSGGYADPNHVKQQLIFDYKLNLLRSKLLESLPEDTKLTDQEIITKYHLTRPEKVPVKGLKIDDIISAPNAYQCGVTMYDCVTAGFDYYSYIKYLEFGGAKNVSFDKLVEQGTSFAAPVVSGLAAILKQQFPWMSASNLKTTILTTATDIGAPGVDPVFGWGFINAALALKGPQMFAFGDFVADLSGKDSAGYLDTDNGTSAPYTSNPILRNNYYFVNNISGKGGLIVEGNYNDFLYLTGNNTYKGKTIVNGGHLVVQDPYTLGFGYNYTYSSNYGIASLTSDVYVNNRGFFSAHNSKLASIYNNGIVELDNTHLSGNYTQSDNAVLIFDDLNQTSVDGNVTLGNTGTIVLKHNNPQIKFVSLKGKYYILLNSKTLSGHFANQVILNNSPLLNYRLYYSQNPGLLALDIKPQAVTSAVNSIISSNTIKDQNTLLSSALGFKALNDRANALFNTQNHVTNLQVSAANTRTTDIDQTNINSNNIINAATHVQGLNATELKQFLYATANTIYPDVQLANSVQAHHALTQFSRNVSSKFSHPNNQRVAAYLDYSYNNTTWNNKFTDQSQIFGKQILNGTTFGVYDQYRDLNLGLGLNYQTGSWHENLDINNNKDTANTLAYANTNTYGLNLTIGKALPSSSYAFSTFIDYTNYNITRTSFFNSDQTSKFQTLDFGVNFDYHKLILGNSNSGVILSTGINLIDHYQFAFNEITQGISTTNRGISSVYQLNAKASHNFSSFVNVGFKAYRSFNFFGLNNKVGVNLNVEQALVSPNYNLKLKVNDAKIIQTTNSIMQANTIGSLGLQYNVEPIKDLNVQFNIAYILSNSWYDKAAKVSFTYKF